MSDLMSCCGVLCGKCDYYPDDCAGCAAIEGKAFWLEFTGGDVCDIYNCCIVQRGFAHCGLCGDFPCPLYTEGEGNPTLTREQNEAILQEQIRQLTALAGEK